jgi:hypothetical protein
MIYILHKGVNLPIDQLIEIELDAQFKDRQMMEDCPNPELRRRISDNTERVQKLFSLKDHNNGRKATIKTR